MARIVRAREFVKWGKYEAASIQLAADIMGRGYDLPKPEQARLAQRCEWFLNTVDTYLHRGQFQDALKLMLEFRRKPLPTSFTSGTAHWLKQAQDEQRNKARLVKGVY